MHDNHLFDPGSLRRVLMFAFHFPPFALSSGVQRTLRILQHVPHLGWRPIVLSAHPRAYATTSPDLLMDIPPDTVVEREFALDAGRHLAVAGRYPEFLARPDRWRAWALGAIPAGLSLIRQYQPEVIWSTYPIATAHLIAARLHRLTGIPLVADFRDPMAQEGYPEDPRTWQAFSSIEKDVASSASSLVFVTPSARATYRARYSEVANERFVMIENGFDEEFFAAAESGLNRAPLNAGRFTLLHSGIVYPLERDPTALFAAPGRMRRNGRINASTLRIRFRAPVHDELLKQLASQSRTLDLIEILPAIPYRDALREMLQADGLLVMQPSNCNEQIPAKLYEYLRAQHPILGLADPAGDTGMTMHTSGVEHIARLEDSDEVESAMTAFLAAACSDAPPLPLTDRLRAMSRRERTRELATLLERVSRGLVHARSCQECSFGGFNVHTNRSCLRASQCIRADPCCSLFDAVVAALRRPQTTTWRIGRDLRKALIRLEPKRGVAHSQGVAGFNRAWSAEWIDE